MTNKVPLKVPGGKPFIGVSRQFLRDPLNFILSSALEYGDIVHYTLGNIQCYGVNHPDGIQRVLQDNGRNYIKGDYFKTLSIAGGNGLLTSEGETWLRQRRLMSPVFHRQRVAGFTKVMVEQAELMLERWEGAAQTGTPIDIEQEFHRLTMRIITQAMFSIQVDSQDGVLSRAIASALADLNYRLIVPLYPGLWAPTPRNVSMRRNLRIIDEVVYQIIQERRRRGSAGDDLLGLLMEARDEETGQPMSEKQLRDEVVTIFVAGHETTAAALTWLFYLLDKNPKVDQAVRSEALSVLGGNRPDIEDVPKLVYTHQVLDETMRLYPPVWLTNRTVQNDDEICGYGIPAGAEVMISPYVTHRLPEFWPEPEKFYPDRFTPENSSRRPRFAFLPFGGGPHQCIGNQFALLEAILIVAAISRKYRLRLAPGEQVRPQPAITLRTKDGLKMLIDRVN